jgi:uncharacterized protein YneF (UPF0154 family)
MNKGARLWIALSIIAVFLAGLAGGILLDKTLLQKKPRRPTKQRSTLHFPTLEIMAEEMGLSQEQQDRIRQIFRDSEEGLKLYRKQIQVRFDGMRKKLLEDIKSILDDQQVKRFDAMIEKYRAARKREYEQRRKKAENGSRKKGARS